MQSLGIIPCTISWLFKLINERKEKTGARFSVRISAVEVWGKEENLRDLLSEVATGSLQDGQSPGVYLCEDPICGTQVIASGARWLRGGAPLPQRLGQVTPDPLGTHTAAAVFTVKQPGASRPAAAGPSACSAQIFVP